MSLVRIESFEVEEIFWEVRKAVQSNQVGHTLLTSTSEAGLASTQTAVAFRARLSLADAEREERLARLDRQGSRIVLESFCRQEHWVLKLHESAEFRSIVGQVIVTSGGISMDEGVVSRH